MTQYLIIGVIVSWALLYATWVLVPAAARRAAAARLAAWARRCGLGESATENLQAKLAQSSACGECSRCAGCAKPPQPGPDVAGDHPRF